MKQYDRPDGRKSTHAFESLVVPQRSVGIHWFGQSSFAFKDPAGTILQVDPYFPRDRSPEDFIHRVPPLYEETLKTDFVLLTHEHGDHTCMESLLRIRSAFPEARYYGPKESMAGLGASGIPDGLLTTVAAGDTVRAGNLVAYVVWAKPSSGIPQDGIPAPDVEHLGYVLEIGSVRVYVSGDLFNSPAQHDEFLDPIIQLNPDIGLLTTHPTEGEFPDFGESVAMAVKLKLKAAVPSHYGCFHKRTFDPRVWASQFPSGDPVPIIIPYNGSIVFRA
jgi:L-ascorbate metabolism protein UlaG (beta-lactamase superfamily)